MGKRVNGKLIWAIFLLLWVVLVRFLTGCSVEKENALLLGSPPRFCLVFGHIQLNAAIDDKHI